MKGWTKVLTRQVLSQAQLGRRRQSVYLETPEPQSHLGAPEMLRSQVLTSGRRAPRPQQTHLLRAEAAPERHTDPNGKPSCLLTQQFCF